MQLNLENRVIPAGNAGMTRFLIAYTFRIVAPGERLSKSTKHSRMNNQTLKPNKA